MELQGPVSDALVGEPVMDDPEPAGRSTEPDVEA
jgi:hypothetical protein